jgi:hypothetical protein
MPAAAAADADELTSKAAKTSSISAGRESRLGKQGQGGRAAKEKNPLVPIYLHKATHRSSVRSSVLIEEHRH